MFFTNRRALFAAMSSGFAMLFMLFFDGILSIRLVDMGMEEKYVGYIFSISCFCSTAMAPFAGLLCKYVNKRLITFISFIVSSIALLFFGPSELLGFPDKIGILIFGIAFLGVAIIFIFVPLLPEIIEVVSEK